MIFNAHKLKIRLPPAFCFWVDLFENVRSKDPPINSKQKLSKTLPGELSYLWKVDISLLKIHCNTGSDGM